MYTYLNRGFQENKFAHSSIVSTHHLSDFAQKIHIA